MKHFFVTCLLLLAACATPREVQLTDAQLTGLQPGKTTSADIISQFGEPSERRTAGGAPQLVYAWTLGRKVNASVAPAAGMNSGSAETQRREIVLTFGEGDLLKDIERRTLTTRSGYMNAN